MAKSIFQGLMRDPLISRARARSKFEQSGDVIFHAGGGNGWGTCRNHFHGRNPGNAWSEVSYPGLGVGDAALLSAAAKPEGAPSGFYSSDNAAIFANFNRTQETGIVTTSAMVAVGNSPDSSAVGGWFLCIDTQSYDNTKRAFPHVQCQRDPETGEHYWSIRSDAGTEITLPGSRRVVDVGDNENKYNMNYVELGFRLDGGTFGGYHHIQINETVWTETELTALGAGHAIEPPQVSGPMDSFGGGLNFGLLVYPHWTAKAPTVGWIVANDFCATINDSGELK